MSHFNDRPFTKYINAVVENIESMKCVNPYLDLWSHICRGMNYLAQDV